MSVVFVDLVGHTSRSELADPEDVRATLGHYYARVRVELEKFGGTVEKFIGDAVMAVFGAPVSHEDDPERAVRAALAVRDAMVEDGLDVRIAVNTGEALVALDARPEAGEAVVAGDVVNTAARLQSAAPVNGVLVGEATHRATSRAIDYEEADGVDAKGKAGPVGAWVAVAPRARFGVDVRQHGGAPLVGRDAESRLLTEAFARARRERALQVVTLIGVPGIGKSRLVWELFQELDRTPDLTWWRQGRSLAYGGGLFGALAEAVRSHIGVLEGEGADEIAPKLDRALDELPLDDDDRAWLLSRLRPLLGIASGEPPQRAEAFAAWQRLLEAMATVRPFVLVLEDLHWADDGTLDFLDHLADWAADVPLLVVATARPELLERRPGWGGGKVNTQTLALRPLDEQGTAELLGKLLERPVIDAGLQSRLLQQAGGNPLYAEEFARMVSEAGTETAVPDSVQGIIAARIDVLGAGEKALLQDAAVLGKVFWRGGLRALGAEEEGIDDALQRLARKEFIRRESGSIVGGDAEFAFRHALVRDVAYSQLPRASRATKHRLAAEWIDSTTSGRPDLVAHHYVEALELARATGAATEHLEVAAAVALRAAGRNARSLAAYSDALALYERALELLSADDGGRSALLLELARTALDGGMTEEARAYATDALALFDARGEQAGVAGAEAVLSRAAWAAGDGAASVEHAHLSVEAALASGDDHALAYARSTQARVAAVGGRPDEALSAADEAIELADRLGLADIFVAALIARATARGFLDLDGWREDYDLAIERGQEINAVDLVSRALNNRGSLEMRENGPRAGEPWMGEVMRLARRSRLPSMLRWTLSMRAGSAYAEGRWDEALAVGDEAFTIEPGTRHYLDAMVLFARGSIALGRAHEADAVAVADVALARARDVGDPQQVGPLLTWGAFVAGEVGDLETAQSLMDEVVSSPSILPYVNDASCVAAWAAVAIGADIRETYNERQFWSRAARAIAEGRLEDAIAILDEGGAATEAAYTRLQLALRSAEPEPWLTEADAFYRSVGATRYLLQLDELRAKRRSA